MVASVKAGNDNSVEVVRAEAFLRLTKDWPPEARVPYTDRIQAASALVAEHYGFGTAVVPDMPPTLGYKTTAQIEDKPLEWDVKGVLPKLTYGAIGGVDKSLKTYHAEALALALGTGYPYLNQPKFVVPTPRPVYYILGEGGESMFKRRLNRMKAAMGVPEDTQDNIHLSTAIMSAGSPEFESGLKNDLVAIQPALVIIDPWYMYQGKDSSSAQRNEVGGVLARLGGVVREAGASLMLVDHLTKTGQGKGIHRFNGAGMPSWVDSWLQLYKASSQYGKSSPDAGSFVYEMHIGSRQWGSQDWIAHWEVGAFDFELNDNVGDVSWDVHPLAEIKLAQQSKALTDASNALWLYIKDRFAVGEVLDRQKVIDGAEIDKDDFAGLMQDIEAKYGTVTKKTKAKSSPWIRIQPKGDFTHD